MRYRVIILGAGPAGLGAGYNFYRRKHPSWKIFEATRRVGGLSSSRVDKNGFTWDLGGHVIFSQNSFFNSLVEKTLGRDALTIVRRSYVMMSGRFIPFPLQNNIHRLPKKAMEDCFAGMKEVSENRGRAGQSGRPKNFEQWVSQNLGVGIAKHFMLPHNRKLWAFPLDRMGFGWIDGRVALPSLKFLVRSIKTGGDETTWGPNARFRFPQGGGTGSLFSRIAEPFIENIAFRHEAAAIDPANRKVLFKDGSFAMYKNLITSAPLDVLIKKIIVDPPADVLQAAADLRFNSGWMVGIGINRKIETKRSWVYFPERKFPFYRVTYFSNYSPSHVPHPETQTSFLCEVSFGETKMVNGATVIDETVEGLVRSRLIRRDDVKRIATRWKLKINRLYPIPSLKRDAALEIIKRYLEKHGILSIGRFGGWRYEKGNMDHCFMAGYNSAAMLCRKGD
ncbi:MAG: amine oxidase [bacterium]|nr:MAG: amine oxidase [bacterium]